MHAHADHVFIPVTPRGRWRGLVMAVSLDRRSVQRPLAIPWLTGASARKPSILTRVIGEVQQNDRTVRYRVEASMVGREIDAVEIRHPVSLPELRWNR